MIEKLDLKIYIQKKAFQKYRYFIDLCETEISGFGKVVKMPDNKLVITDFQIFKQTVSGAHSDMDDDALAAFLFEKTKAGESLAQWRVWWHSHATMQCFFSGTDTGTIDASTEFPWLISIVGNHAGDIKARIDVFDPIRCTEDLKVEVIEDEDPALKELCLKEIKEKVLQPERTVYMFPKNNTHYPNQHHGGKKGKNKYWGGHQNHNADIDLDDEDIQERLRK